MACLSSLKILKQPLYRRIWLLSSHVTLTRPLNWERRGWKRRFTNILKWKTTSRALVSSAWVTVAIFSSSAAMFTKIIIQSLFKRNWSAKQKGRKWKNCSLKVWIQPSWFSKRKKLWGRVTMNSICSRTSVLRPRSWLSSTWGNKVPLLRPLVRCKCWHSHYSRSLRLKVLKTTKYKKTLRYTTFNSPSK